MLIFISYSHLDKAFADFLADTLREAGFEVWHDITSLRGGEQWAGSIDQAVRACEAFLVVLTPDAANSPWVTKETLLALDRKKRVIPLLLATVEIPVHLFDLQYLDFRGDQHQALNTLLQVLKSPAQPLPTSRPTPPPTAVNPSSRTVLREVLVRYFNDDELHNLCFDLGIDYDDLGGDGSKSGKARELISYLERRNRLGELVQLINRERPKANLDQLLK